MKAVFVFVVCASLLVASTSAVNPDACNQAEVDGNYNNTNAVPIAESCSVQACFWNATSANEEALAPINLVTGGNAAPESRLENDKMYITFTAPQKMYNHELLFFNKASETQFATDLAGTTADDANPCGEWTLDTKTLLSADTDACVYRYEYSADWSDIYDPTGTGGADVACGWTRSEDASAITFQVDFAVSAIEDLATIRGVPAQTRTTQQLMPLSIVFPKTVPASYNNIRVFAPIDVQAAIIETSVSSPQPTNDPEALVRMITSVQFPFYLDSVEAPIFGNKSDVGDVGYPTAVVGATSGPTLEGTLCPNDGSACVNTWTSTIDRLNDAVCEFDGTYRWSWRIKCHTGEACPLDSETDVSVVEFTLDTSHHCPVVVDTVDIGATLTSYETDCNPTPGCSAGDEKDDFLDTQTVYYVAYVSSSKVSIASTSWDEITVTKAGSAAIYLQQNGADQINSAAFGTTNGGAAIAGDNSTPEFFFVLNTGSTGDIALDMAADEIETVTVNAIIDVTYENAGQKITEKRAVTLTPLSGTTETQQHRTTGSFSAGQSGSSSTASSSSALVSTPTVVLGGVVLLVIAAIVIVMRNRRSAPASKDVQLQRTSSQEMVTNTETNSGSQSGSESSQV